MKYSLKVYCPRPGVYTSDSLVFVRILVSNHKPLASWLPLISIVLHLASPWLPIVRSQRLRTGSQHQNFRWNSTVINEMSPQSILASIVGFTLNGLVFVPILDSHHKPLASWLPFISVVLLLASSWLPIVRSQRLRTGSQHYKFSMKFKCN